MRKLLCGAAVIAGAMVSVSAAACLDKNFGLVLIVFDRLFGTFASAPKDEVLRFGVAGAAPSADPLRVVFGVWLKILSDAWQARGLGATMRALFGAPH